MKLIVLLYKALKALVVLAFEFIFAFVATMLSPDAEDKPNKERKRSPQKANGIVLQPMRLQSLLKAMIE